MKKLIHKLFPGLKPKYFIVHGIRSNPYGEAIYPFIFDVSFDKRKSEIMVKRWMDSEFSRGFWDCHDTDLQQETNTYSFKTPIKTSSFMMGSHSCKRTVNKLKYFTNSFSGPTDL